jgi:hypothetical protein
MEAIRSLWSILDPAAWNRARGRFLPNVVSSAAFMAYGVRYRPCNTPSQTHTHFCLESLASSSSTNTVYRSQNQTSSHLQTKWYHSLCIFPESSREPTWSYLSASSLLSDAAMYAVTESVVDDTEKGQEQAQWNCRFLPWISNLKKHPLAAESGAGFTIYLLIKYQINTYFLHTFLIPSP